MKRSLFFRMPRWISQQSAFRAEPKRGELQSGESWTLTRVDVLAMVPEWVFNDYSIGDVLTVEVHDGANPQ